MINVFGYIILFMILIVEVSELYLSGLNISYSLKKKDAPQELPDFLDIEEINRSLNYQNEKYRINLIKSLCIMPLFYILFISGMLGDTISYINQTFHSEIVRGIVFFSGYMLFFFLLSLPFNSYNTFVIEKKYGFNTTTPALFIRDTIVSIFIFFVLLSFTTGGIILLIDKAGVLWWIYASGFMVLFMIVMQYLYPALIAPLFNTFTPLKNKDLQEKIHNMAKKAEFPITDIYQMDASRRSTHSNAYFTGLFKKKRIVLFDTLLEKHSEEEIVGILSHEIGHYTLKHILKMMAVSSVMICVMFFLMAQLIHSDFIYKSFGFEKSYYAGIFVIFILFSPVNFLLTPLSSFLARKHEYEADLFAITLTTKTSDFKQALINLHKDNLSNPYPHPLYVKVYYSHPPLLSRLKALDN